MGDCHYTGCSRPGAKHHHVDKARRAVGIGTFPILGYDDIEQAIQIANDTDYGLAGYVSGADLDKAREVARKIRALYELVGGFGTIFDRLVPCMSGSSKRTLR